ncbi:MAG TPA: YraN family protein [Myxococcota bacterium]|jgi:putative endonuclease
MPKPPRPPPAEHTTTAKGRVGEDRAVLALEKAGYQIVGRNVRVGRNELDIVAHDGTYLVFVEVRKRERIEDAMFSIDGKKQAAVIRAATAYLARLAQTQQVPFCRFDVVVLDAFRVEILKNAFEARY